MGKSGTDCFCSWLSAKTDFHTKPFWLYYDVTTKKQKGFWKNDKVPKKYNLIWEKLGWGWASTRKSLPASLSPARKFFEMDDNDNNNDRDDDAGSKESFLEKQEKRKVLPKFLKVAGTSVPK